MRKLLTAAAISVIAMAWMTSPQAIEAGIGGTVGLATSVVRVVGAPFMAGGTAPATGGHVETLPDGTQVWIPDSATQTSTP